MTRRQFIVSCIALAAAWLTGLRKLDFRRFLSGAYARLDEWPVGFLDVIQSTSVHGLTSEAYVNWHTKDVPGFAQYSAAMTHMANAMDESMRRNGYVYRGPV